MHERGRGGGEGGGGGEMVVFASSVVYKGTTAADLKVGLVRAGDELLQRAQLLGLGIGIHQLSVHLAVLGLLAHHDQVLHQILIATRLQAPRHMLITLKHQMANTSLASQ